MRSERLKKREQDLKDQGVEIPEHKSKKQKKTKDNAKTSTETDPDEGKKKVETTEVTKKAPTKKAPAPKKGRGKKGKEEVPEEEMEKETKEVADKKTEDDGEKEEKASEKEDEKAGDEKVKDGKKEKSKDDKEEDTKKEKEEKKEENESAETEKKDEKETKTEKKDTDAKDVKSSDTKDEKKEESSTKAFPGDFPSLASHFGSDAKVPLVGLLFSAAWCPDCKPVVPKIASLLSEVKDASSTIRMVYVSSEKSSDEMEKFLKSSKANDVFETIPFKNTDEIKSLKQHFKVCAEKEMKELGVEERKSGLPTLKLLSAKSASVVTENAVADFEKLTPSTAMEEWKKLAENGASTAAPK